MPTSTTPPSLDALLASFHAAPDSIARTLVAMALVRTRLRDDRILAALIRLLDENPVGAAACLARHGDARAIPDLVRALDSDELVAQADCAICAAEILEQIAHAIELLGGTLTEAQRARLERNRRRGGSAVGAGLRPVPAQTVREAGTAPGAKRALSLRQREEVQEMLRARAERRWRASLSRPHHGSSTTSPVILAD